VFEGVSGSPVGVQEQWGTDSLQQSAHSWEIQKKL
jgi:hypothetical protein